MSGNSLPPGGNRTGPDGQAPVDELASQRELERALDRLLERDSPIALALRSESVAAGELPPAALDASILSAARLAVATGVRPGVAAPSSTSAGVPRWWQRARVPMAAAAMLVLAVSVTTLVEREQRDQAIDGLAQAPAAPTRAQSPAPGPGDIEGAASNPMASERLGATSPTADAANRVAPAAGSSSRVERAEQASATEVAPAAPAAGEAGTTHQSPAAADVAPATRRQSPAVADVPPATPRAAASAALPAPAASAQPTQAAPPVARRSREGVLAPDKWLEDILSLRRAGRLAEADAALAEFRKAYPDHPLPPLLSPSP